MQTSQPSRVWRPIAWAALAAVLASACNRPAPPKSTPPPSPLAWAYPAAGARTARPIATRKVSLPGAARSFSEAELKDLFAAVDWRPDDHGPMPAAVSHGRRPDVMACGFCHLPTGQGRPENAALAGLPSAYILAQLRAFKDGDRRGGQPDWVPSKLMIQVARGLAPQDAKAAADYFSHQSFTGRVRVVEAATIPRMRAAGFIYRPAPGGGREALGQRIVEGPDDFERFEMRDDRVGYTAYVPPGAIGRGLALAGGGDGVQACASCHGPNLDGSAVAPPIAGRSPSYLARQLFALHSRARHAPEDAPMQAVTAPLTTGQMIDLAAYVGSLKP